MNAFTIKKNFQKFVFRAIAKHGNGRYFYNATQYKALDLPILIMCLNCKKGFIQTPKNHLKGDGCPNCYPNRIE